MKKLVNILLVCILLVSAFVIGRASAGSNVDKQQVNKIEVIGIYRDQATALENNFYIDAGEIAVDFSDGSFCIVNTEENFYMFQPALLGDWSMEFNNKNDMENCIKTYISIAETGSY